jgi:hypothetical protein
MPITNSGPISFLDIVEEFGGTPPHSLSEYYRSGGRVPEASVNNAIPTFGQISLSAFYGAANALTVAYEIIGGGGGGGSGASERQPRIGTFALSGGASSISSPGIITTIIAAGGAGGGNHALSRDPPYEGSPGESSLYGVGGTGGGARSRGGDATGRGAGGGGGGGRYPSTFYRSGAPGEGGRAGTRVEGTFEVFLESEKTFFITIGSAGPGDTGGSHDGGNGSPGYARLTFNNVVYEFFNSGTLSIPSGART